MTKQILLVDDDALLRRSLAFTLERAGYRIQTAGSAEEGLMLASKDPPDLIHIRWLRKKIENDPNQQRQLITVHGQGYKLVAQEPGEA